MAAIEVKPVRSRRDLKRFIKLPWRIYRNAENWVPPLVMERKRHLDKEKNPFFEHAEAEYFLAWRDGEPVGRITAHVDHRFNEFQDNDWGMFGFFEAEEDQEVADALLGAAEAWLRERGRDRMVGPMDFSTNHECGVLVEGFDVQAADPRVVAPALLPAAAGVRGADEGDGPLQVEPPHVGPPEPAPAGAGGAGGQARARARDHGPQHAPARLQARGGALHGRLQPGLGDATGASCR